MRYTAFMQTDFEKRASMLKAFMRLVRGSAPKAGGKATGLLPKNQNYAKSGLTLNPSPMNKNLSRAEMESLMADAPLPKQFSIPSPQRLARKQAINDMKLQEQMYPTLTRTQGFNPFSQEGNASNLVFNRAPKITPSAAPKDMPVQNQLFDALLAKRNRRGW